MLSRLRSAWPCVAFLFAAVAFACQVPVFRYALERWRPDAYELVVVHEGNFTAAQKVVLSYLEESLVGPDGPVVNLLFETLDLAKEGNASLERWQTIHTDANITAGSPSVHLFYPEEAFRSEQPPLWSGELSHKDLDAVLDSPARQHLVERALQGDSAVWLLLESGDKEKDDALAVQLEKYAAAAREEIDIPEGVIRRQELQDDLAFFPSKIDDENVLEADVPLKIDFSIHRLSRDDPEEEVLLAMLLNMEADLLDEEFADVPMLFPVFGKGRALWPLLGEGINEENVLADCGYLCGPCSCQVKKQNPGMDLLVKADWLTALAGTDVVVDKELPPLTGVEDLIEANASSTASARETASTETPSAEGEAEAFTNKSSPLSRKLVTGVVLLTAVLLVGSFLLRRKQET